MQTETSTILALDVGARRIGLAVADGVARLARPLTTMERSDDIYEQLQQIITEHGARVIVVGLPRDMDTKTTQQTHDTLEFVNQLKAHTSVPVYMQDEAVTSKQAEAELEARHKAYSKGDIDALAATYILADWLGEHQELIHG